MAGTNSENFREQVDTNGLAVVAVACHPEAVRGRVTADFTLSVPSAPSVVSLPSKIRVYSCTFVVATVFG